jgi:hypothetical protein
MTCFTDRRPFRLRRVTPAGELEMIVTAPPVYAPPSGAVVVGPEQALCDLAWMASRRGGRLAGVYTFRNLDRLNGPALRRHRKRYPDAVSRLLAEVQDGG